MTPETAIHLVRQTLLTALWISAPLLIIGFVVGIVMNILQVATSLQDSAVSALPRLIAYTAGFLIVAPWMLRQLSTYTVQLITDLPMYVR